MSTEIISIPQVSDHNGIIYYQILVKLPLRSINIQHRYSDFEDLVEKLCDSLGINSNDFPYPLPSKRINWFKNKTEAIINERKLELSKFLNLIIRDSTLQNNKQLHEFLQLPINFKFNSNLFKSTNNTSKSTSTIANDESLLSIDYKQIDENTWLEIFRILNKSILHLIQTLQSNTSISDKLHTKDKINRLYQPAIKNLSNSLSNLISVLKNDEYLRRKLLIKELDESLYALVEICNANKNSKREVSSSASSSSTITTSPVGGFSRRVFGSNPQETKETIGVNNQDLLQQQVQIHKQQDQEVEQLRKLVVRQRLIAETINNEVAEQNYLLDQFNSEVEDTKGKLRSARKQARNIL